MRRQILASSLACALTACGATADGGSDASGPPPPSEVGSSSETPAGDDSTDAAAMSACTDAGRTLAPLAANLAGGDLESALLSAEIPDWEPSGTTPTVELALGRMELQLSFAKQAVELGVFGADGRADLHRAYDALAEACAGIGSGF